MGKAFDWDELEKGNLEAMAGNCGYTINEIDITYFIYVLELHCNYTHICHYIYLFILFFLQFRVWLI